jgi:hypothetical protein
MRKYFFMVLLLTMFSSQAVHGQAAILALIFGDKVASQNFHFSLKLGGALSNVTNLDDSKFRFGMNVGLMASIKLTQKLTLVPEICFVSLKGARNIPNLPSGNQDLDNVLADVDSGFIDLNYIDLPVLLRYYATQKFYFGGGLYVSYLTSASNFYSTTLTGAGDIDVRQYNKDDFFRWDYGVAVEVSYAPHRTNDSDEMNLHLRFTYGFADILKDNPGSAVNNYSIQGSISIPFLKKSK